MCKILFLKSIWILIKFSFRDNKMDSLKEVTATVYPNTTGT